MCAKTTRGAKALQLPSSKDKVICGWCWRFSGMNWGMELRGLSVVLLLIFATVLAEQHCHRDQDGDCQEESPQEEDALRLILVGKTGSGKSATGNTILGEKKFNVSRLSKSETRKAQLERTVISGRTVEVVDTPSLFDNRVSHDHMATELIHTMATAWPGAHGFLFVLEARDLSPIDFLPYQRMKALLGDVHERMVVVVTHWDLLAEEGESEESFVEKNTPELKSLLKDCGERLVFFDNKSKDRRQVERLFEVVQSMKASPFKFKESHIVESFEMSLNEKLKEIDAKEESYFSFISIDFGQKGKFYRIFSWIVQLWNWLFGKILQLWNRLFG